MIKMYVLNQMSIFRRKKNLYCFTTDTNPAALCRHLLLFSGTASDDHNVIVVSDPRAHFKTF